jgi:hypothetical protein
VTTRAVPPFAAACLLAAGVCLAAEVTYHATYEAAIAAAKEHGRLLLIVVEAPIKNEQGVEICKVFREQVLGHASVAEVLGRHFSAMILDIAKVQAKQQAVPPVLQLEAQIRLPLFLVYKPSGELVLKHEGYAPPDQIVPKLREAAKALDGVEPEKPDQPDQPEKPDETTQPKVSEAAAAAALKQAKAAAAAKDYVAALAALKPVVAGATGAAAQEAQELATEIEAKANEALEEGERLEGAPKLGSAIRAYRRCVKEFHGAESAARAAERIKALQGDAELRARVNAVVARKLLAAAEAAAAREDYAAASEAVETLLKRYEAAPEAPKAKALREKLEKDPAVAARLKEDGVRAEAERLLNLARSFRLSKQADKALAQYKLVIEKYPGTRFAATAERLMKEIESEQ